MRRRFIRAVAQHSYVARNPAVFVMAFGGALIALEQMLVPHTLLLDKSALGASLHYPAEVVWAALGVAGGLAAIVGMWRRHVPLEVFGFTCLGGVWGLDAYAIFHARGFARGSVSGQTLAVLAFAYFIRVAFLLWEGRITRNLLAELADVESLKRPERQ